MTCHHTGDFGTSLGCRLCNEELADVIDSPVRLGCPDADRGRHEFPGLPPTRCRCGMTMDEAMDRVKSEHQRTKDAIDMGWP